MTSYETITPEEVEQELQRFRRDQAFHMENLATVADAHRVQFAAVAKRAPEKPNVDLEAADRAKSAEIDRGRADELHKLAGTSPAEFLAPVIAELRGQLAGLERQHIQMTEMANNPALYGGDPNERKWNAITVEEGIKALKAKIKELEKEVGKK